MIRLSKNIKMLTLQSLTESVDECILAGPIRRATSHKNSMKTQMPNNLHGLSRSICLFLMLMRPTKPVLRFEGTGWCT